MWHDPQGETSVPALGLHCCLEGSDISSYGQQSLDAMSLMLTSKGQETVRNQQINRLLFFLMGCSKMLQFCILHSLCEGIPRDLETN